MKRAVRGFTIVELLIVIVVIAILAAISIVAYNGIQQRANNTARISNASNAIKLVKAYMAAYGNVPSTTGNSCVGNGFANNNTRCWGIDSATPSTRNSTLNDVELIKVGSLPTNTTPPVQTSAWQALGPVYLYNTSYTVDGTSNPLLMLYFLDGANQECGLGGVVSSTASNTYVTVNGTPRNSGNLGNATQCFIAVK